MEYEIRNTAYQLNQSAEWLDYIALVKIPTGEKSGTISTTTDVDGTKTTITKNLYDGTYQPLAETYPATTQTNTSKLTQ
jgi:hypothetical protein